MASDTENIDETPSGKLLHEIMANIAEFYSANLAQEARTRIRQKAISGGILGRSSTRYVNVRKKIDGREIRTINISTDRVPRVQWVFDAYAAGE